MAVSRLRRVGRAAACGVLMAALGGCAEERGEEPTAQRPPPAPRPAAPTPAPPPALPTAAFAGSREVTIADVAERTVASVVNISSEKVVETPDAGLGPFFNDPFFREFFGERLPFPQIPRERRERSLGSGVIVQEDGVILTNHHVVEKAREVRVTLADGRELEAKVVGLDPPTDVAVLRLEGELEGVTPLPFGDSDRLRLGDVVLAIGNPFGVGQTVTMGIVSAKGRANVGIVDYEDFIQTDAAINPGNSGGALVDTEGRLVGINTAIISRSGGYQGIGFAIPSNMASRIMESLLEQGRVVRGWLGVVIQNIDADLGAALELPSTQGVLIADVAEGSPAAKAGLRRGDVVVRIEGEPVDSVGRLRNRVAVAGAGAKVTLEVLREGDPRQVEVELGELPSEAASSAPAEVQGALGGLGVAPLDDASRRRLGVPRGTSGVVVTEVAAGSPAARAGVQPGDVIREVDRRPVRSVREFRELFSRARGSVALLVQRGDTTLYLALRKN